MDGEVERQRRRPGQGGLCHAQMFKTTEPITLYRVYSARRRETRLGGVWTADAPRGRREVYRRDYAVCSEWSDLDAVVACELPAGASVIVGVGQSLTCDDGEAYPQSGANQLLVPDAARLFEHARCSDAAFPCTDC